MVQYKEYIDAPEARQYPKLSVKLYGKGVTLDVPADGTNLKMQRHQLAKTGQVILSEIWGKKGAIGFVPPEGDGALCTSHFFLFDVRKDRMDPTWLQAIFTANYLETQLDLEAKGTTGYAAVRPAHLLKATIPLPPLEEQRRIIRRIETVLRKVRAIRELRQTLGDERQALMKSARRSLVGSEPLGDWIQLGHYVKEIENGWSPACENHPSSENQWGVLKVGAVSFGEFRSEENKELPISLQPIPAYEIKTGDFLMSRANTTELVGACAFVRDTRPRLMLCDKIFRFVFTPDAPVSRTYLGHVLKSPALRVQIEKAATGTSTTMKNISKDKVFRLLIPRHSQVEQEAIAAELDCIEAQLKRLYVHDSFMSAELEALPRSIFNRAFSGQL